MVKISGSELLCRSLQAENVSNIFTVAGDHVLPALDAMADADFRLLDTRREQGAVHMADAWARVSGQPGVCLYTTPGLANALPALLNALDSESPLLSISGCAEQAELGRGAMQEFDQIAAARPLTKGAWMVHDARRIPETITQALRVAFSGRWGPVHVTIPLDVQEQHVDLDEVTQLTPLASHAHQTPLFAPPQMVDAAITLLKQAERPLVFAGNAAGYTSSGDALARFIDETNLPVFTDELARGLVSDEHPSCLGFFERSLNNAARLAEAADVILLLGRKQNYMVGYTQPPVFRSDAKLIQIDPEASEIGRNRDVALGVVADIEAALEQLTEAASQHNWPPSWPWIDELRQSRAEQRLELEALSTSREPLHAMAVHQAVSKHLREDDCLVFDGGDFCHFGRSYLPARQPKRWLYLASSGMLGSALPSALGALVAYPDSRVVLFCGDGAFGYNAIEIDTAVRHNLPVVIIIGNDAAWGIDRQIQLGLYGRPVATDLLMSRYDHVAEGLGAHGEFVEHADELEPALARAFGSGRPAVINVAVDRAISPRAAAAIASKGRRP